MMEKGVLSLRLEVEGWGTRQGVGVGGARVSFVSFLFCGGDI